MPISPDTSIYGMPAQFFFDAGFTPDMLEKYVAEDAPVPQPTPEAGLGDAFKAGFVSNLAGKASTLGFDETANSLAQTSSDYLKDPEFQKQLSDFSKMSAGEAAKYLILNPGFSLMLGSQSLGNLAPDMAAALASGPLAGMALKGAEGVAALGTLGAGTFSSSAGNEKMQIIQEIFGTNDPEKIKEELAKDPELEKQVWDVANRRGFADALANIVGFGIAGRVAPLINAPMMSARGIAAEAGAQAVFSGYAPEKLAQELTLRGTPSDLVANTMLEVFGALPEAVVARLSRGEGSAEDIKAFNEKARGIVGKNVDKNADPYAGMEALPTEEVAPVETPVPETKVGPSVEEKQASQEKILTPAEKTTLTGTPDQRQKRLTLRKREELEAEATKRGIDPYTTNAKGTAIRKTKADLAKEILAHEGITATTKANEFPTLAKSPEMVAESKLQLPNDLRGAKPKFGFKDTNNDLSFASDVDKALYIVSQKKKSARDADYRAFLREQAGLTEADIDAKSAELRNLIKEQARTANGTIKVNPYFNAPATTAPVQAAPVASALTQQLRKTGLNPKITLKPETEAALQARLDLLRNPNASRADQERAVTEIFTGLKDVGFFDNLGKKKPNAEAMKQLVYKAFPDISQDHLKVAVNTNPQMAASLMREASQNAVLGDSTTVDENDSPMVTKVKEIVGRPNDAVEQDKAVPPKSLTPENMAKGTAEADAALDYAVTLSDQYQDFNRTLNSLSSGSQSINDLDWATGDSTLALVNKARMQANTVAHLSRKFPIFGPIFWAFEQKARMAREMNQALQQGLSTIVDAHGADAVEKAYFLMDEMSGPWNKGVIQKPIFVGDGRLKFTDRNGTPRLADIKTSMAFKDLQKLHNDRLNFAQAIVGEKLRQSGYAVPVEFRRSDLTRLRDSLVGEKKKTTDDLDVAIDLLDQIENIKRITQGVHFPNMRKKGPFGVSFYVKDPEGDTTLKDGTKANLRYFGSIEKANFKDAVNPKSEKEAIDQALKDMAHAKEEWVTYDGGPVSSGRAFKLDANNLKSRLRSMNSSGELNELVSSLLFSQGVDPKAVSSILEGIGSKKDLEKMFVGLRDRGSYYGYDTENRLGLASSSMGAQSYQLSNFVHNSKINRLRDSLAAQATGRRVPTEAINRFQKYVDDNLNYGDANSTLRSLAYNWFMFANPSSGFMQAFTPLTITVPYMAQYGKASQMLKWGTGLTAYRVAKDIRYVAQRASAMSQSEREKLRKNIGWSPEQADMYDNLDAKGYLSESQQVDDESLISTQYASQRTIAQKAMGTKIGKTIRNYIPFMERASRTTSFNIIYDIMKDKAVYEKFLAKKAQDKDAFWMSFLDAEYNGVPTLEAAVAYNLLELHGYFGKVNRPDFLNSAVGATAFPMCTYIIGMCEALSRTIIRPDGRVDPDGLKTIAMLVATAWLWGGAQGLPLYQPIDWFTKFFTSLGGKKRDAMMVIEDTLNEMGFDHKAQTFMEYGPVQSAIGVNWGARMSINPPFTTFGLNLFDPSQEATVLDSAGAVGTIIRPVQDLLKGLQEGQTLGEVGPTALTNALPAPLKNLVQAKQLATGDLRTGTGVKLMGPAEDARDYYDIGLKTLGFTPMKMAEARRNVFETRTRTQGAGIQASQELKRAAKAQFDYSSGKINAKERDEKFAASIISYVKKQKAADPSKSYSQIMGDWKQGFKAKALQETNPKASLIMEAPRSKRASVIDNLLESGD